MLPGDLLEQLEGLARGRQPERRRRDSGPSPQEEIRERQEARRRREEVERRREEARQRQEEARRKREEIRRKSGLPPGSVPPLERSEVGSGGAWGRPVGSDAIGSGAHEIHRSHADYGTDPSSRALTPQHRIDPLAEPMDAQGTAVRRQLLRGGRAALREAVVLKEVLGQPLALRGDHLGGTRED